MRELQPNERDTVARIVRDLKDFGPAVQNGRIPVAYINWDAYRADVGVLESALMVLGVVPDPQEEGDS